MAAPEGWTVGPAPVAPQGWTPGPAPTSTPAPDFRTEVKASDSPDWLDRMIQWLPEIGGALGGTVGGVGGTVFGLGVGGVPGAAMGAAVGGGAGEAYKELINRARGHVVAPKTSGEAAMNTLVKQPLIQGASQLVGDAVVGPAMSFMGKRLMQSAVKPGLKTLVKGVRVGETTPMVVKTLMKEGVNVTPGGLAKLQTLLESTNDEIASALAGATGKISPLKVAGRLSSTAKEFATQVNPQADLEAISQVGQNFLEAHPDLTVQGAQALKRGTYRRIGEKYGTAGAASIEAEKALGRGLKEEIAAEVPDVTALNQREGQILEALHAVGKRVALAGNRDPVGFAWVAKNPTTFLAALIDRSPLVKSMLARGLYQSAGTAAKVSPSLIRVAVHALSSEDSDASLGRETSSGR